LHNAAVQEVPPILVGHVTMLAVVDNVLQMEEILTLDLVSFIAAHVNFKKIQKKDAQTVMIIVAVLLVINVVTAVVGVQAVVVGVGRRRRHVKSVRERTVIILGYQVATRL